MDGVTLKDVLDGRTGLVGGHLDDFVDVVSTQPEGLLADHLYGRAVGEEADLGQGHAAALAQRLNHGVGVVGLDADDTDVWGDALEVDGDAGDQAAAADAAEDGGELADVALAQQLHGDGALAGNDVWVVEGRDVGQAVLELEPAALVLGGVKVGAEEHHPAAQARHVLVLDVGRAQRHDNGGGDAEVLG